MKKTIKIPTFVAVGIVVVFTWASLGLFASSQPDPGKFGDMFGAVNALFTGLAFAVLIYTVILQTEELRLQRRELRLTRNELRGQKQEFSAQNKTIALQRFESSFFSILRVHHQIIDAMDLYNRDEKSTIRSRDCFRTFYNELKVVFPGGAKQKFSKEETSLVHVSRAYEEHYGTIQHEIGHYFRNLYHLINFVDKNYVDGSDFEAKRRYTNLVRAQLSSYELTMIFYNCLSSHGREKFKPLVERYALLKNMDKKLLIDEELHVNFFSNSAYGVSN